MGKYIPPEKMTIQQILQEIENEYTRWNQIANNGCQDPFWPDGCNMNLIRNHIIYWYNILATKQAKLDELAQLEQQAQLSLFTEDQQEPESKIEYRIRPIPPEVPNGYMVAGCKYSNRLKDRKANELIWGHKGQYQA